MVDSIKGQTFVGGSSEAGKAIAKAGADAAAKMAAAAQAAAAAKAEAEAAKAKGPSEGFDDAKKKPVSITGKHKPPEAPASNPELQNEVLQGRMAAQAGGTTKAGPSGVNSGDGTKQSSAGKISKEQWDNPQLLLSNLTQTPASGPTVNSPHRCGPSAVLGASIMQGPDATSKYLTGVADAPKNNRLSDAEKTELKGIATKVKNKEATFEDMGRAQDLTYKAGNRVRDVRSTVTEVLEPSNTKLIDSEKDELKRLLDRDKSKPTLDRIGELVSKGSGHPTRVVKDPDSDGYLMTVEGSRSANDTSAYTEREVAELAEIGGTMKSSNPMPSTGLKGILKDLKPGESAVVCVAGKSLDEADKDYRPPDHFVTIGKRKDGTPFIYNSDPTKGDATLFVGNKGANQSAAFAKELKKYDDRTGANPTTHEEPRVLKLTTD